MKRGVIIPYMLGVILGVIIVGMILEDGSCLGYRRVHLHPERYNRWKCKMPAARKEHTASEIEFRLKNIAVNHPEKISFNVLLLHTLTHKPIYSYADMCMTPLGYCNTISCVCGNAIWQGIFESVCVWWIAAWIWDKLQLLVPAPRFLSCFIPQPVLQRALVIGAYPASSHNRSSNGPLSLVLGVPGFCC